MAIQSRSDCAVALAGSSLIFGPVGLDDHAAALERVELALQAGRTGLWDWNLVTDEMHADARTCELWGLSRNTKANFLLFSGALHPKAREHSKDVIAAALDPRCEHDWEYECRTINELGRVERWISVRGRTFFENGRAVRVLGTVRDITERKRQERHVRVLLRELMHRSKNLLAMVQAMSRETARGATSMGLPHFLLHP